MQLQEYVDHPLVHANNQLLGKQLMAIADPEDPALHIDRLDSTHPITGASQQIYLVGKTKFGLVDEPLTLQMSELNNILGTTRSW